METIEAKRLVPSERELFFAALRGYTQITTFGDATSPFLRIVDLIERADDGNVTINRQVKCRQALQFVRIELTPQSIGGIAGDA